MDGSGLERCELEESADAVRLSGTTLLATEAGPVEIQYSVALDHGWRTTTVGVHVRGPGDDRSVALCTDGSGTWTVGEEVVAELQGATDVDFAWTPATNTTPIRRLRLDQGASAAISVVHVPYPDRQVSLRSQTYERLGPRRYRYTSGDFQADLTVDDHGLVRNYPGQWTAT